MSDIKCPYCNKTLHCGTTLKSDEFLIDLYHCSNKECESTEFLVGCKEFWDIMGQHRRTRKALEITVDALTRIIHDETIIHGCTMIQISQEALKQITELEQKGE